MIRKAILLIIVPAFLLQCADAAAMPGYIQVLNYFFKHHNYDQTDWMGFMKKKDGWYVYTTSQEPPFLPEHVQMLWSEAGAKYLPVTGYSKPVKQWDTVVFKYIYSGRHIGEWVGFERCVYFGYDSWAEDVIKEYEGYGGNNDTTLESLGRAYSAMAEKYLWYQMGGSYTGNDPLMKPVDPAVPFPHAKLMRAMEYMDKDIAVYARLAKKNPEYMTMIGKAPVKYQNELMNAWNRISVAGYDAEAAKYLQAAEFDALSIRISKDMLDSCPDSAVLFTYGDNETYILWWVQQRQGYRKDVAVINSSMLGTTRYLDYVKRKNLVRFNATPQQYQDSAIVAAYIVAEGVEGVKQYVSADALVAGILKKEGTDANVLSNLTYYIAANPMPIAWHPGRHSWVPDTIGILDAVPVKMPGFLTIDNIMMLDIITENIDKRPICFTTNETGMFEGQQLATGMVLRLLPVPGSDDENTAATNWEARELIEYLKRNPLSWALQARPDIATNTPAVRKLDILAKVARYQLKEGDKKAANATLDDMRSLTAQLKDHPYCYMITGDLLLTAGRVVEGKQCMETSAQITYDKYKHPSLLNGYNSASKTSHFLRYYQERLLQTSTTSPLIDKLLKSISAGK